MLEKITSYLSYYIRAKSAHGLHSPFVFDFYNEVLHDKRYFAVFDDIEILRDELEHDQRLIEVDDYGASGADKSETGFVREIKSIAEIAARTLVSKQEGELLFRMVEHYNPVSVLELGTSLGISSLYLAMQNSRRKVLSLEGSINIAEIAKQNFKLQAVENIDLLVGPFEQTLPLSIKRITEQEKGKVGMVFIDGNHRYEPTMKYFQILMSEVCDDSFFVFHDINWSAGMRKAWQEISNHPQVTISIDMYTMGVVFIKPNTIKQHFILR